MSPARPQTESPFGVFLRARRDRLTPRDVGIAPGLGRRRTPGLRREEVATLAGISVDYYVRLERGSERRPSVSVVDALARALQLDDHEAAHLRELAAVSDPTDHSQRNELVATGHANDGVRRILDALRPLPAIVTNRLGDLIAWNPGGLALLAGITDWPPGQRNVNRYAFQHPGARTLYVDWEAAVAGLASALRRLVATHPEDADLALLVAELRRDSPDFVRIFDRYDVDVYRRGQFRLNHPVVGEITPEFQVLRIDGTDGLTALVFHAEPGTPEYAAFHTLDSRVPAAVVSG